MAVVGSRGAGLLDAPDGDVIDALSIGTALYLLGRSEDEAWLNVQTSGGDSGWVDADQVVAFNTDRLPVVEAAPEPVSETATESAGEATPTVESGEGAHVTTSSATESREAEATPTPEATTPTPAQHTLRPTPVAGEGDVTGEVVLKGTRLNVRSGPGVDYRVVAKAYPGEQFLVLGRNGPADWVQIALPDEDVASGWVAVDYIRLTDPVVDLPITSDDKVDETTGSGTGSQSESETGASETESAQSAPAPVSTGPTGLSGKLVFQTEVSGDIYIYELDTGTLRWLTNGYDPEISRDGSKVTFVRFGGEQGVWAINSDGSDEHMVFGERHMLRGPKWSPDGKYIVFSRSAGEWQCDDIGFGVCIILPSCPDDSDLPFPFDCPLDNIDSTKRTIPEFALARVDDTGDNYRDLNVLNTALAPDWNEAGIVYDSTSTIEITEDKPDAETRQVYAERWTDDADWQPGGGLIAYQSRQGSHWEIFAIQPENGSPFALTRPETTLVDHLPSNVAPAWSPDGQHIVYLSNREDNNEAGDWRIWVMDADGGAKHPLPIDVPIEYAFSHEQMVGWGR